MREAGSEGAMHFDRRADHGLSYLVHFYIVSLSPFMPVHRMMDILGVFLHGSAPPRSVHKLRLCIDAEARRR